MTYAEFKIARDAIEREMSAASAALQRFPRSEIGLTPDSVKALPEFQSAKRAYAVVFARLREVNAAHLKRFSREILQDRRKGRGTV
jgi:hypothetical protein